MGERVELARPGFGGGDADSQCLLSQGSRDLEIQEGQESRSERTAKLVQRLQGERCWQEGK